MPSAIWLRAIPRVAVGLVRGHPECQHRPKWGEQAAKMLETTTVSEPLLVSKSPAERDRAPGEIHLKLTPLLLS